MATTINLSSDSYSQNSVLPECEKASFCAWFEKTGRFSNKCANRDSTACSKYLDDVFSPYKPKK